MKAQLHRISFVLGCIVCLAGVSQAQVSGVPGDGIPDVYYWAQDGVSRATSGELFHGLLELCLWIPMARTWLQC